MLSAFASPRCQSVWRRFVRDKSGALAIEFGILAPVFFMLLVGVMQLSFAYFKGATMQWAVDRAVRIAMIDSTATITEVRAALDADLGTIGTPDIEFSYVIDDSGAVPLAHVVARYVVPVAIPLLPEFSLPFQVDSYVPVPSEEN